MSHTTLTKIFAERYCYVPEHILNNKDGRYQELTYLVHHDASTSPEQEARRLLEALKTGGLVHPCYCIIVAQPE